PLNILFCGSDAFSIYSLRALHALQTTQPHAIHSIEVVCRPDKRVGRNLKNVRQVPIKSIAEELELPLHQLDTFKGWSPAPRTNLVVAVSFGLLVPARILGAAKYGGLNVHPSLLPDLRGPAPIPRALLGRRERTGVTLQTMHPTQFDRGVVLERTAGVDVEGETVGSLVDALGRRGAELLCGAIERGLFLGPFDGGEARVDAGDCEYASKITAEDRRVNWTTWSSEEILLRDRVLGRLW
ncbi:formyl transferase, partial [Neohortaea acidophila]